MSAVMERSEPDAADLERYQVHSRLEIVAILRSLIEHRSLVTVSFGGRDDFIVSAVLAVNPDFEELILDHGADVSTNARLLQGTRLEFSCQLDHIRILFTATRAENTIFQDAPAFRIRMPQVVTRIQRRDDYRIKVPLGHPLHCIIAWDATRPAQRDALRVLDLSRGGLSLTDYSATVKLVPRMVYRECSLTLGEVGTVSIDLEAVHLVELTGRNNVRTRRCGCRFVGLPNATATLIQRYINKVERDQKALT
jgi:c-di-GMP-binding flagellar brake protein YcgR